MSDKKNTFVAPAAPKTKATQSRRRQSMMPPLPKPSTSKTGPITSTAIKDRNATARVNNDTTIMCDLDSTIVSSPSTTDFEEDRRNAYYKFLRTKLEEVLVDEKIEREEREIDAQLTYLGKRYRETLVLLDKTNQRVKDIAFVGEQKRLLDLKKQDCSEFYKITTEHSVSQDLKDLNHLQQASLDHLDTSNVDFGYDTESGHKQLLDAVEDALAGLDQIKKHSKLDGSAFEEYEKTTVSLQDVEKSRKDLERLKNDFETKFLGLTEKLLKEASESLSKTIEGSEEDETLKT